jgi:hypothetical protein
MSCFNNRNSRVLISILIYSPFLLVPHKATAVSLIGPSSNTPVSHIELISEPNKVTAKYEAIVSLSTLKLIPVGAVKVYQKELERDFPAPWKFVDAQARYGQYSLKGEFESLVYEACGTSAPNDCPVSTFLPYGPNIGLQPKNKDAVGALFTMRYKPAPGEPSGANANYVQVANSSYSNFAGSPCVYPANTWYIDRLCNAATPFYLNALGLSSGTFFADRPFFSKSELNIVFMADLFFVKQDNNNLVTLYDGVSWGWRNDVTRVSKVAPSLLSPLSPSPNPPRSPQPNGRCFGDASCYGNYYAASINSDLIIAESDILSDSNALQIQEAESVPTPALLPGMIATGIYHGRKWRKRKQRNQNNDSNDIAA